MMGLASSHDSLTWANTAPAACPTLKRSNFLTLINHLTQKPDEEVNMAKILQCDRERETVREAARPGCGTVNCIAGDIYILKMLSETPDAIVPHPYINGYCEISVFDGVVRSTPGANGPVAQLIEDAAKWLGLPLQDGWNLFYGFWSDEKLDLNRITKSAVLTKLRNVAETGVV